MALLKDFEGCELTAYRDLVGVPTIGYGHTKTVMESDVGKLTISEQEAERLLLEDDLPIYEAAVAKLVKVPLTAGQTDALIDFAYNLGAQALAASTLLRKLNGGDYLGAANEFGRWIYAGHEAIPGLVRRRKAERELFMEGVGNEEDTTA